MEELQHHLELQLAEVVIQAGLGIIIVMILTITSIATLMVGIAVDLMSIRYGAQNVSALKQEGEELEELQHHLELQQYSLELQLFLELQLVEAVIQAGVEIITVMISTIISIAILMVGIVVDLMLIHFTVMNVNALKEEVEELHPRLELQLLEVVIRPLLGMIIVMISTILPIATLTVGIAVDLMSIHHGA